jgi:hypothetical protein
LKMKKRSTLSYIKPYLLIYLVTDGEDCMYTGICWKCFSLRYIITTLTQLVFDCR